MLLTSKGAAGVAGGGFIALTATLSTVGHVPAAGIMLVFGIDKFMSECRAIVNFCGNAVATLFVARWENGLDLERARRVLAGQPVEDPTEPEAVQEEPERSGVTSSRKERDAASAQERSADREVPGPRPADDMPSAVPSRPV